MKMEACECEMNEDAPPGREKQVKSLKKAISRGDIPKTYKANGRKETNPWAIAWAQHKKHGKPGK